MPADFKPNVSWRPARHRMLQLLRVAIVGALVFVSAWGGIELTREAGRIASIWLANGLLVGILLRTSLRQWPLLVGVAYLANCAANLYAGDSAAIAIGLSLCNAVEVLVCALPLYRKYGTSIDLMRFDGLAWFTLAATLTPVLTATMASAFLYMTAGVPMLAIWGNWYASDALGLLILAPLLLTTHLADFKKFSGRREYLDLALSLILLIAVAVAVFSQSLYPLLFIVFPVVTGIIARHGPASATVCVVTVAVVAILFTIEGFGPFYLIQGTIAERMYALQAFLAILVVTTLPMAARMSERERLTQRLILAKAEADRANKAKSDFLASMSHEIRTPLNSVIGFSGIVLNRRGLDRDLQRQVELIQAGGEALLKVLNNVLDFSKIEAAMVEVEKQPFSLRAIVDNCISLIRQKAEMKGLQIGLSYDPGLPKFVLGDATRIQQVLNNLLSNALKFTSNGRIHLAVSAEESGATLFNVTDTGIGISEADQTRLFQDFSQVDSSISRRFGGTGLGLAISKRLVELMGGQIGVVSQTGAGSNFWFRLQLPETEQQKPLIKPNDHLVRSEALPSSILVVDDLDINLEIAAALLTDRGHRVATASSAAEAVAMMRNTAFDLVLMDVQMPETDGIEATRRIRALGGACATVPIIALTANVFVEQIVAYKQAGMNDHVGKPFQPEDLYRVLARWLPSKAQGDLPMIHAETFSQSSRDQLAKIVGPDRVHELTNRLSIELRNRFNNTKARDEVAHDAHCVTSTAGMLGFGRLSTLSRSLEEACKCGGDYASELAEFLRERDAATQTIERLWAEKRQESKAG